MSWLRRRCTDAPPLTVEERIERMADDLSSDLRAQYGKLFIGEDIHKVAVQMILKGWTKPRD